MSCIKFVFWGKKKTASASVQREHQESACGKVISVFNLQVQSQFSAAVRFWPWLYMFEPSECDYELTPQQCSPIFNHNNLYLSLDFYSKGSFTHFTRGLLQQMHSVSIGYIHTIWATVYLNCFAFFFVDDAHRKTLLLLGLPAWLKSMSWPWDPVEDFFISNLFKDTGDHCSVTLYSRWIALHRLLNAGHASILSGGGSVKAAPPPPLLCNTQLSVHLSANAHARTRARTHFPSLCVRHTTTKTTTS